MDISFYVLLTMGCLVLLLAMWVCAASNTPKWGPDLTLELPPHLLQEALFGKPATNTVKNMRFQIQNVVPSAPSDQLSDPLLSNEHPMGVNIPPPKSYRNPVLANMDTAVQVLPTQYVPSHKLRPVFYTFKMEEPA